MRILGWQTLCEMKVTKVGPVLFWAQSAGLNPSGERSECEHACWDPKDGAGPDIVRIDRLIALS